MVRWSNESRYKENVVQLKTKTKHPRTANGRCKSCQRSVVRTGKESGKQYLFCKEYSAPTFIVIRDEQERDEDWECEFWLATGSLDPNAQTWRGRLVFAPFTSERGGWVTIPGGRQFVIFRDCPGFDLIWEHSLDRSLVIQWGRGTWKDHVVIENVMLDDAVNEVEEDAESRMVREEAEAYERESESQHRREDE